MVSADASAWGNRAVASVPAVFDTTFVALHTKPMTKTERPVVENSEYVRFARRIMRALSRRAGANVDTLPELRALQDDIEGMIRASVRACHAEGYSWAEIATRLGVSKQAAQQRYGVKSLLTAEGNTTGESVR